MELYLRWLDRYERQAGEDIKAGFEPIGKQAIFYDYK